MRNYEIFCLSDMKCYPIGSLRDLIDNGEVDKLDIK